MTPIGLLSYKIAMRMISVLSKEWTFEKGLGLSLALHLVVFAYFGTLGGHRSPLPAVDEMTIVEIKGHSDGDGLAAKKPQVLAVAKPVSPAVSNESVVSNQQKESSVMGREGGTQSSVSGTGQYGVENGREAGIEERYSLELRQLMDKYKVYPVMARKMGIQGRVMVRFTLDRNGAVQSFEVVQPAGAEILNSAAKELVKKISGLKPFPQELNRAAWQFEIPVEYRL